MDRSRPTGGTGVTAEHGIRCDAIPHLRSSGTFTVRLTVTDNAGATGTATTTASIQAPSTTGAGDIVLTAADVTVIRGNWARISSTSGAGGQICRAPTMASPGTRAGRCARHYFEAPFMAAANTNYQSGCAFARRAATVRRLGLGAVHGRGVSQGAPLWRTGTTSGQLINLEACAGCGLSGWGWQNSTGVVRFQAAGPQTIRIQPREDGVQVDQIVLSPVKYLTVAPGSEKNDGTVLPRTGATLTAKDVVLRADDSVERRGNWLLESDSAAADGRRLGSVNQSSSFLTALASPANYVDVTFTAVKGVKYRTWLRLSAAGNSKSNDSVWIQYDGSVNGSGAAVNRIGTTSAVLVESRSVFRMRGVRVGVDCCRVVDGAVRYRDVPDYGDAAAAHPDTPGRRPHRPGRDQPAALPHVRTRTCQERPDDRAAGRHNQHVLSETACCPVA